MSRDDIDGESYPRNIDWYEFSVVLDQQTLCVTSRNDVSQFRDTLHATYPSRVRRKLCGHTISD